MSAVLDQIRTARAKNATEAKAAYEQLVQDTADDRPRDGHESIRILEAFNKTEADLKRDADVRRSKREKEALFTELTIAVAPRKQLTEELRSIDEEYKRFLEDHTAKRNRISEALRLIDGKKEQLYNVRSELRAMGSPLVQDDHQSKLHRANLLVSNLTAKVANLKRQIADDEGTLAHYVQECETWQRSAERNPKSTDVRLKAAEYKTDLAARQKRMADQRFELSQAEKSLRVHSEELEVLRRTKP